MSEIRARYIRGLIRPEINRSSSVQDSRPRRAFAPRPIVRIPEHLRAAIENEQAANNSNNKPLSERVADALDLGQPRKHSAFKSIPQEMADVLESLQAIYDSHREEIVSAMERFLADQPSSDSVSPLAKHLSEGMKNSDGTPMQIVSRELKVEQGEQHKPVKYENGASYPGLKRD